MNRFFLTSFLISVFLSRFFAQNPDKHDYFKDANTLYENKKYVEAIIEYDKYLENNPNDPSVNYNRALCRVALLDYKGALNDLLISIKKGRDRYDGIYVVGFCYFQLEAYQDAIPYFDNVIIKNPDFGKSYIYKAASLFRLNEKDQEQLDLINKGLQIETNNAWGYFIRSKIKQKAKDLKGSLEDAEKAVSMDKVAPYYYQRGYISMDLQRYYDAIVDFDIVLIQNPKNADAYYNKGTCYLKLKKYEEAILALDKALELNPTKTNAYHNRGLCKFYLERNNEAIVDFNASITLSPSHFKSYTYRAACKVFLKDFDGASKDLNKAIELNKNFETIYLYTAMIKCENEKYEEAIIECNKGITLIKTENLLFQRGVCEYKLKRYEDALNDFNEAISLENKFFGSYLYKGLVYVEQQKNELAIENFTKVLVLAPQKPDAYYQRGICRRVLGQNEEACWDVKKAKELKSKDAEDKLKEWNCK